MTSTNNAKTNATSAQPRVYDLGTLGRDVAHTIEVEVPNVDGRGAISSEDLTNTLRAGTITLRIRGVRLTFSLAALKDLITEDNEAWTTKAEMLAGDQSKGEVVLQFRSHRARETTSRSAPEHT